MSVVCNCMLSIDDTNALEVNGTRLAVVEAGKGDPLVLVHGGVSDLRSWSSQLPVLSRHFRTICYSRRYHVPNTPISNNTPDPVQKHVDDLAQLIEQLDAPPAHIVGHSWGGLISFILAMQKPDLCRSLVLIEPPTVSLHVEIPPKPLQILKLLLTSPKLGISVAKLGATALGPAEKAFRRGDDKAAIEYFGRGVLGDQAFNSLTRERYQQVWDNRGPDRAQALYQGFPDLRDAAISDIAVPVLLVSGSLSPSVFRLLNESLVSRLTNGRHRVIPNASHIVHEDAPKETNSTVLNFLEQVG